MKTTFLREMAGFVVLVLLQTLVLNRISVFGVAVPILYIYFLIKLPKNRNCLCGYFGVLDGVDHRYFLNTPGMNAAATTIVATLRKPLMNIFFSKVEYEDFVPSIYTETGAFLRYSVVMVLLHQTLLFFIESFTFFNLTSTLIRIGASSVLTLILIIALDGLMYRKTSGV